jgi:hypothetical protein
MSAPSPYKVVALDNAISPPSSPRVSPFQEEERVSGRGRRVERACKLTLARLFAAPGLTTAAADAPRIGQRAQARASARRDCEGSGSAARARFPALLLTSLAGAKLIFVMVGLPARGKTYIARKLRR